ncbi:integrase family protein [Oceanibaculum indicum P24]|uniref:Integrase family protein n=2 Tax=Oceanibaculum indicum TaxID=526216 RepID=K2JM95_9PROT|nr:integrase family protein [Oceanibaculum indicum P24]
MLVQKTKEPGRFADGGGLYLQISRLGGRSWLFRYTLEGRAREMGLGAVGTVSLAEARAKAADVRKLLATGVDPLADRQAKKREAEAAKTRMKTFKECATAYIAAHEPGWRNPKHRQQWKNTLYTYAYPILGDQAVGEVDLPLVLSVLEPIWTEKPETASRVRGRIEAILDWATVRGLRSGDNPARWRGHLDKLLVPKTKIRRVRHHPAMPYDALPAFMVHLRARDAVAAQALEFIILTAARTSEALEAVWSEVDLDNAVWTVPGERMKAGRPHRVPLTRQALAVLEKARMIRDEENGDYVFPGWKTGRPLSNMSLAMLLRRMDIEDLTVHGFRSTFRDWAAEQTSFAREVAEMALAHAISDKVEAAYRRGDLFEKRRRMMQAWADFCDQPPAFESGDGKVTRIRAAG